MEATVSNWSGHFSVEDFKQNSCWNLKRHSHFNNTVNNNAQTISQKSSISILKNSEIGNLHKEQNEHNENENAEGKLNTQKYEASNLEQIMHCSQRNSTLNAADTGDMDENTARFSRLPARMADRSSRSQPTAGSSLLSDSLTDVIIEELQNENEPTSALLGYCKKKFLQPYLILLSTVGLRPTSTDSSTLWHSVWSCWRGIFIICLLLSSYCLHFVCAYRGDRGFAREQHFKPNYVNTPHGNHQLVPHTQYNREVKDVSEFIFGYIVPSFLHLCGFLSALIICKLIDQEQLQNLVERVFLLSLSPRHLCRYLWTHLACGLLLLILLFSNVVPVIVMQTQMLQIKTLAEMLKDYQLIVKIALLMAVFIEQFVEIIIICSYCIECFLLRYHLETLSYKLLMHSIDTLDWMREMMEFRKLLNHLNQHIAVPICFFIIMNLTYALAGLVYLFRDFDFYYSSWHAIVLSITNVLLSLTMGLIPFFMAASVTRVCQHAKSNGHQIRVRPFVYHNTTSEDLNSMLLFSSSLDMSAKLFRMPIQSNYLCFAIILVLIVVLTLGMCINLTALGKL